MGGIDRQNDRRQLLVWLVAIPLIAFGDEPPSSIDLDRVFPLQRNPLIVHSQKKEEASKGAIDGDSPKSDPKDTKLNINGNGGSSTRGAGGKAMLLKRIPLD